MKYGLISIQLFDGWHQHSHRYKEGNWSVYRCTNAGCLTEHADKIK